jgi:hypothetical protein
MIHEIICRQSSGLGCMGEQMYSPTWLHGEQRVTGSNGWSPMHLATA